MARHSSHPVGVRGVTSLTSLRCLHCVDIRHSFTPFREPRLVTTRPFHHFARQMSDRPSLTPLMPPHQRSRRALHPDVMRRVDYWVGVPLCFILTLLVRLATLLRLSPKPRVDAPRNVLLIELAEMGTTVLACPAIQRLRARHPDAAIYFLLFRQIEESIRVLDVIPQVHVLTIDASSLWTVARDTVRFTRAAR